MLYYDLIDLSEEIDPAKSKAAKNVYVWFVTIGF